MIKNSLIFYKLIVIFIFLIAAGLFYSNPDQFLSDNSLFYPVVAQNIVNHGMSSFNGYIETNGFQPLWMLFSVLAVTISHLFDVDLLVTIGVFYHLFLAGAIVIVFKMSERWSFFSGPIVSIIFIFMFIANGVLHNMESAMALFFVLLTIYYALSVKHLTSKSMLILGLLVGVTFLSRLDLIFFGMITTFYTLYIYRKELFSSPTILLFYLLGFILTTTPYFIYNEMRFGDLLPISDSLANGFPTLSYAMSNIYPYGTVSLAIAFIEWGVAWTAKTRKARELILIMSLSTIFQIVYVAFFQHPQSWYFITGFVNFAVIIGYLLQRINYVWLTRTAFVGLIVVTIGSAYLKTVSDYALSAHVLHLKADKVGRAAWNFSNISQKLQYAEDIKKVLPKGTTVTVGYFPGALAYYAKLKVFASNGLSNGLIANTIFDEMLAKEGIEKTFQKYNITHHILPLTLGPVKWYSNLGFSTSGKNNYIVMLYSKVDKDVCGVMRYHDLNVSKAHLGYASTGYAGIFPTTEIVECSEEMKDYKKSGFYSTIIGK